jgi:hypothetical protein
LVRQGLDDACQYFDRMTKEPEDAMILNMLTKLLPYALMAFVGVAGWSMNSVPLLAIVVLGTMGVAIGTALATQKVREEEIDLAEHESHHEGHAHHEHQSHY